MKRMTPAIYRSPTSFRVTPLLPCHSKFFRSPIKWFPITCTGVFFFFFSSRRRDTRCLSDWSSDVCSSDLVALPQHHCGMARHVEPALTREGRARGARPGRHAARASQEVSHFSLENQSADAALLQIGRASCRERV